MCGIAGFAGGPAVADGEAVARAMSDVIAHRGPDGDGRAPLRSAAEPAVNGWLSHRRLKVVDLSQHAHQPMESDDGLVALVFNGEIYNFRELRAELEGRGHRFRSSGDTEVILRAYLEWGRAAIERLDGMFALAVWDGRAGTLLLARDRTGKKPLYYALAGGRLTFASEVKALAAAPWVALEPDLDRLGELLVLGNVPWPATPYAGIAQVPPAGRILFDARAGTLAVDAYWEPPAGPQAGVEGLAGLLDAAVQRRLVADVPLGALLSGGIDSSLVCALAARHTTEPLRTFSAGFADDASFDERPWAELVASRLGTRHTAFTVRADAIALLDRLLWHHDGPFGDSSAIPTYLVTALAAEHVTVVLTGDGGDEVFAGYERFAAARLALRTPRLAAQAAGAVARLLPSGDGYNSAAKRLRRFAAGARSPLLDRYLGWIAFVAPETAAAMLGRATDAGAALRHAAAERPELDPLAQLLHVNLRTYLPDDLHPKVDRMSMANSVEVRCPLLDTAVVEHALRIPARERIGLRMVKPVLRRACGDLLPDEVWQRRKHGFGVPVDRWFHAELAPVFEDEVLGPGAATADVLARDAVDTLWREHRDGRAQHGHALWTILTIERWLRHLRAGGLPEPSADRPAIVSA